MCIRDSLEGAVANGEEPQVSASVAPGVSPNLPEHTPSPEPVQAEPPLQAASLTAGQQRAAQWSASGVAGCPTSVQRGARLVSAEPGVYSPSCSKLMRDEWEVCPVGTMGDTNLKALQSVTIPSDYYEPQWWTRNLCVGVEKKDDGPQEVYNPVAAPSDVLVVSCPNGSFADEQHASEASTCVWNMCGPSSSLLCALPATIPALSDRSYDHALSVFNNSSPLWSVLPSNSSGFPSEWTIFPTESGRFPASIEQIYRVPLFKKYISDTYSHEVQVFASPCDSFPTRALGASCIAALRCCGRAFRCKITMGKGFGDRPRALSWLLRLRADELLHQFGALQDRANEWQRGIMRVQSEYTPSADMLERLRECLRIAESDVSRLWDIAAGENFDMGEMIDRWIELQQRGVNPFRWHRRFSVNTESSLRLQIAALQEAITTESVQPEVSAERLLEMQSVSTDRATLTTDSLATRISGGCPRGHGLYLQEAEGNFCNHCGRREIWPPALVSRCEGCDYDLCQGCCAQLWSSQHTASGTLGPGAESDISAATETSEAPPSAALLSGVASPTPDKWRDSVPQLVEDFFQMYTLTAMESRVARGLYGHGKTLPRVGPSRK